MKCITLTPEMSFSGSLILVNATHPLRQALSPDRLSYFYSSEIQLEHKTALILENLFKALNCRTAIVPVSGYRSLEEQEEIYASSLEENGADFTRQYVALPNCSEHQTGFAIDLGLNQEHIDFIRPYFPRDGICGRFREKMAVYGFIERYQESKEEITGISSEPWHFRYVGFPHSSLIERYGFALEEYLDYISQFPYEGKHLEVQVQNKSFEIFYRRAEDCPIETEFPGYLPFQVSGTNTGGFVFTLWR